MTRRMLYRTISSVMVGLAFAEAAPTALALYRHLPIPLWLGPASACLFLLSAISFAVQSSRPASDVPWNYTGNRRQPITSKTYRRSAIVSLCLVAISILLAIYARYTHAELLRTACDCPDPLPFAYLPWGFAALTVLGIFATVKSFRLSRKLQRAEFLSGGQQA